jgi:hypothetical protein
VLVDIVRTPGGGSGTWVGAVERSGPVQSTGRGFLFRSPRQDRIHDQPGAVPGRSPPVWHTYLDRQYRRIDGHTS